MVEYQPGLDATYGALSSPVRRAIVQRLAAGEQRVTDIARPFDVSLAAVSKHIRVLEEAGVVRRRIEGRTHWLALDPDRLAAAVDWLTATRSFWESRLDALEDALAESQEPRR
jgi:DNA-binding transcriptional ArsR family regulator